MAEDVTFMLKPHEEAEQKSELVSPALSEPTKEELEDFAEDANFGTLSEATRYCLKIGMMAYTETDPRNKNQNDSSPQQQYQPLTIRDVLPEDEENAVNIQGDSILERIDDKLLEELQNDPAVKFEGWNVWLSQ